MKHSVMSCCTCEAYVLPPAQVKRKAIGEDVAAWLEDGDLLTRLGGAAEACAAAARGLLTAGAKSFTHTLVALERYQAVLQSLLTRAGPEVRVFLPSLSKTSSAVSRNAIKAVLQSLLSRTGPEVRGLELCSRYEVKLRYKTEVPRMQCSRCSRAGPEVRVSRPCSRLVSSLCCNLKRSEAVLQSPHGI